MFSTPEKIINEIDVGSGGKFSSSSSSGEVITNKFERRLIKPSTSLRSPFTGIDNKKEFYCKPEVKRLYASVILHARSSAEESPDTDNRYVPSPSSLLVFSGSHNTHV